MAEYDNTNRGSMFVNDKKDKESFPDYKGSINVDGTDYWLSGWKKEGKTGTFLSLSVRKKEERQSSQPTRKSSPKMDDLSF